MLSMIQEIRGYETDHIISWYFWNDVQMTFLEEMKKIIITRIKWLYIRDYR